MTPNRYPSTSSSCRAREPSTVTWPRPSAGGIPPGQVVNEKGTPIPNAVVNVWSSDAVGNYDMVGYKYTRYVLTDVHSGVGVPRRGP